MVHLLLQIGAKTYFDYTEISPNHTLNHRHIFGRLLENVASILHKAFMYVNVHVKYSLQVMLISLQCLLTPSFSFCVYPKQ